MAVFLIRKNSIELEQHILPSKALIWNQLTLVNIAYSTLLKLTAGKERKKEKPSASFVQTFESLNNHTT